MCGKFACRQLAVFHLKSVESKFCTTCIYSKQWTKKSKKIGCKFQETKNCFPSEILHTKEHNSAFWTASKFFCDRMCLSIPLLNASGSQADNQKEFLLLSRDSNEYKSNFNMRKQNGKNCVYICLFFRLHQLIPPMGSLFKHFRRVWGHYFVVPGIERGQRNSKSFGTEQAQKSPYI